MITTTTSATLRSSASPYPVLISSPADGRMIHAIVTPVTATMPTAKRATSLKRRTIPASARGVAHRAEGEGEGDEAAEPHRGGDEMDDVRPHEPPPPHRRAGVPLDGEATEGDDGERRRHPTRQSAVGEHGRDEQREGGDRGRHADRPAQRRRQHVVVAQRIEATAEAGDAERRGGDEGDGTEHGCLAAHVEQPLAAVGVEREAEGSGGDEGAGVGDRREDRRAEHERPSRRRPRRDRAGRR